MNNRFFFLTSSDAISGTTLAQILNQHEEIHLSITHNDPFLSPDNSHPAKETVEHVISQESGKNKYNGNVGRFHTFELQNRLLAEKTKTPFRKVSLALHPALRCQYLMKSWIDSAGSLDQAVAAIENNIEIMRKNQHELFTLYHFVYFYEHVLASAEKLKIDLTSQENKLFLFALMKVITYDSADLPTVGKTISYEQMIADRQTFYDLIDYVTGEKQIWSDEFIHAAEQSFYALEKQMQALPKLKDWQRALIDKYTKLRLQTIYYPHITQPLIYFYNTLGYHFASQKSKTPLYSKLISIHLNSNRPAQLVAYFDNIEETADDPARIEIIVNIDDDDHDMAQLLTREKTVRPFTLKFTQTPRPKSFCDLWQPINKLLTITDPNCYFLLNISDEMLFATKGWDTKLADYVGFFPDHIFRLRASRNKFRNYFDRWECSFAQDAIPITTKKWIDIGGDWNPCFGPDSFQQLIAFYLANEGKYSSTNYLRELPIVDINFYGDVPALGIDRSKAWKHNSEHIKAMQICQSYRMQLEARRRAMMLKSHIIAASKQLTNIELLDQTNKKEIWLLDKDENTVVAKNSYHLNRFKIYLTNQYRKLFFNAYFGGREEPQKMFILSFAGYLKSKHLMWYKFYMSLRTTKSRLRPLQHQFRRIQRIFVRLKKLATFSS